jgi:hypothetical protein
MRLNRGMYVLRLKLVRQPPAAERAGGSLTWTTKKLAPGCTWGFVASGRRYCQDGRAECSGAFLDLGAQADVVALANRRDEVRGVKRINRQPGILSARVVRTFLEQSIVGVMSHQARMS